jgi:hypothetical protein
VVRISDMILSADDNLSRDLMREDRMIALRLLKLAVRQLLASYQTWDVSYQLAAKILEFVRYVKTGWTLMESVSAVPTEPRKSSLVSIIDMLIMSHTLLRDPEGHGWNTNASYVRLVACSTVHHLMFEFESLRQEEAWIYPLRKQ